MPATARLAQRLRGHPRPFGRALPSGTSNTLVPHQRGYLPGTMVLETTWHTPTGWLIVTDLLVMRKVDDDHRRDGYRRAPGDGAGILLRSAICISGKVEIAATCIPLFDYGLTQRRWAYDGSGYHAMTVRRGGRSSG